MRYKIDVFKNVKKNKEDEWYVGKVVQADFEIEADPTKKTAAKDICNALADHKVVKESNLRIYNIIIGADVVIVAEKKTGKPICRLNRIKA